jgi:hypothetical protein
LKINDIHIRAFLKIGIMFPGFPPVTARLRHNGIELRPRPLPGFL